MALNYADLMAEVSKARTEQSLPFVAKDGKTVLLRPLLLLGDDELKVIKALLPTVQDKDGDAFKKLEAITTILVAAADKKDSFKKSLADLPQQVHARIFNEWIDAVNAGEASA
ncbi:hypothetical protein AB0G06_43675 [Nonomuraea dietziae]|uniref:hypothetical protein n=1 Tax=Nonomuraea dietziae TaxID=65515 RepID=UPI0033C7C010